MHGRAGIFQLLSMQETVFVKKNVKARLKWCKEHKEWNDEWKKVVFSDESRFCLFHNDGRRKVWRKIGERHRRDCLKPTVKFGGGSVMVWGCFSWWGVGPLVVVDGTLNQDGYVDILNKQLEPYLKQLDEQHPGMLFQDDNAPCHTAARPTQYLETQGIKHMAWPSQSPDLNPIEHLWDELDRRVRKRKRLPTSHAELAAALKEEWGKVPFDAIQKKIFSMSRRIAAVIDAKGENSPY